MNQPIISFLLVLLIEVICAVVSFLKGRLMQHMYPERRQDPYGFQHDDEYA